MSLKFPLVDVFLMKPDALVPGDSDEEQVIVGVFFGPVFYSLYFPPASPSLSRFFLLVFFLSDHFCSISLC
jgi:hypothetical protein